MGYILQFVVKINCVGLLVSCYYKFIVLFVFDDFICKMVNFYEDVKVLYVWIQGF